MTELMSRRRRLVVTSVLLVVLIVLLVPYLWLILTSVKDRVDIFSGDPFASFAPTLDNYATAFGERGFLRNLMNSVIVAAGATVAALAVGVPAGYALSRTTGRTGVIVLFVMLAARLMPAIVLAVPLFILFADTGLLGSYQGLIVAHLTFLVPIVPLVVLGASLAGRRERVAA